ncbi:MAG TPA: carbonic anhydrase family protein [Candidatus Angelobacter sp.]|nr:carbonic anhydrase family protein [Candidatus Angelobacter sp.]
MSRKPGVSAPLLLLCAMSLVPFAQALPGESCAVNPQVAARESEHGSAQTSGTVAEGQKCDPKFTYENQPEWGGQCVTGKMQSPVDIKSARPAKLDPLEFGYQSGSLKIVNDCDHYRIKIDFPGDSWLKIGKRSYRLVEFHFHEPAEDLIDGKRAAMEVHLVHQTRDGFRAVVAVMVKPGAENELIKTLWKNIPPRGDSREFKDVKVDANDLLPKDRGFYTFPGSLTAPACDQGIAWYVLKTPIEFSRDQIDEYKKYYANTARRPQPANGRPILENQ